MALAYRRRWRRRSRHRSSPCWSGTCRGSGDSPRLWRTGARIARNYTLTGSRVLEVPVKFAYWCMSFVMGEAVPDAVLVVGALLLPLVAMRRLARRAPLRPTLAGLAAALCGIGFHRRGTLGLLPVHSGAPAVRAAVFPAAGGLRIGCHVVGQTDGRRDAAACRCPASGATFPKPAFGTNSTPCRSGKSPRGLCAKSQAGESAILVDSTNSDPVALTLCALLPTPRAVDRPAGDSGASSTRLLADPRVRTVWFLRNTHDVSPAGLQYPVPRPSCAHG